MKRVKQRYVALQVLGCETVDSRAVVDAVRGMVFQLFGEYGASQAQVAFVVHDVERNCVVVRCPLKALGMLRASVAAVTTIDGVRAAVFAVDVSGSLRALRERLSKLEKPCSGA